MKRLALLTLLSLCPACEPSYDGLAEATLEAICPGLRQAETWPDCEPPGRAHPVTATKAFWAFV